MTEKEYLELIEKKLDAAIAELEGELELNDRDINNLQELYWENQVDFDEYGYEEYENRQQMFTHINSRSRSMKTLHMYKKMKDSPYFARVDFIFDGEEEAEECYIGIGNFSDAKGSVPLIFDWRAPISSLFYDFDTGRASYEAPAGMVEGEIVRKLQYKIKKGELLYAVESDIKIDDDILKQALSMNADARLKSIVSTIQREQNAIIRNEKDRVMIVQGSAGSGKTSVALHRIAYLLYRHRNELNASQVLILSPNDVFADYISHILPELGEENIREMTFDDYAAKELSGIAKIEGHYDFLEDVLGSEDVTKDDKAIAGASNRGNTSEAIAEAGSISKGAARAAKLSYRGSEEFAKEMNAFVMSLEYDLMNFTDIKYKKLSKSADDIADLFYNKLPDQPLLKRMDVVCDYVVDEYTTLTGHELDEIELAIVKDKFDKLYRTKDVVALYNEFLESLGEESIITEDSIFKSEKELKRERLAAERKAKLERGEYADDDTSDPKPAVTFTPIYKLKYEDVYPVLYLRYLLNGANNNTKIKHLIIDEMQDYSYIQYCIISNVFRCPMTILGDKEQSLEDGGSGVLDFLPRLLGKDSRKLVLDKSYRSTVEIVDFASSIAGIPSNSGIDRHGEKPEYEMFDSEDAMLIGMARNIVEQLSTNQFETIAILCKTQAEANFFGEKLPEYLESIALHDGSRADIDLTDTAKSQTAYGVTILNKDTDRFKSGIVVAPLYLAKGLEFDGVHLINVDKYHYNSEYHRQLLYIGATRALHSLKLYGWDERCELL